MRCSRLKISFFHLSNPVAESRGSRLQGASILQKDFFCKQATSPMSCSLATTYLLPLYYPMYSRGIRSRPFYFQQETYLTPYGLLRILLRQVMETGKAGVVIFMILCINDAGSSAYEHESRTGTSKVTKLTDIQSVAKFWVQKRSCRQQTLKVGGPFPSVLKKDVVSDSFFAKFYKHKGNQMWPKPKRPRDVP